MDEKRDKRITEVVKIMDSKGVEWEFVTVEDFEEGQGEDLMDIFVDIVLTYYL
ncbi:hypothetical protein GCM10025857_31580 [Alicyclobacillus contaminans]|uniref:hypothetical protein n=1 Tax=Alicyclobacillus contaminans TaxID=392016 RepID=UPI0004095D54|nr:hypothetical protein [Alicyclobacillus contaminans]GMA51801.1 hypothetical protein GCM10025857_31580 [Alicyclobacillus contaminans]